MEVVAEPLALNVSDGGVAVTWLVPVPGNPTTLTVAGPLALPPIVTATFSMPPVPVTVSALGVGTIERLPPAPVTVKVCCVEVLL